MSQKGLTRLLSIKSLASFRRNSIFFAFPTDFLGHRVHFEILPRASPPALLPTFIAYDISTRLSSEKWYHRARKCAKRLGVRQLDAAFRPWPSCRGRPKAASSRRTPRCLRHSHFLPFDVCHLNFDLLVPSGGTPALQRLLPALLDLLRHSPNTIWGQELVFIQHAAQDPTELPQTDISNSVGQAGSPQHTGKPLEQLERI